MAITRIQGTGAITDNTASHSTPSITVASGSLISVRISAFFTSPTFVATDCTKTAGTATIGTVTLDRTQSDGNEQSAIWSCIVTGAGTLVMSMATPANTYGLVMIDEFGGSWDATRVEAVNSGSFTTSTTPTSGNATSAGAAAFVGVLAVDISALITLTPGGSGWTSTFSSLDGVNHAVGDGTYKVTGSGGTEAASWTISATPVSSAPCIVAYKEAGGGGPVIDTQPTNQTCYVTQTATFTISATTSGGTLHYQWKDDGSNVGTDSNSYTTAAAVLSDNGAQITCVVTDDNGSTNSAAATWTVIPAATIGWIHA